jgi:putative ABC transport system ATP-binding protein
MIELNDVRKHFRTAHGEVLALDGVTLRVAQSEFLAVQGQSGSGKSTLLSLVGGLALPSAGSIRVEGQDMSELTSAQRAKYRNERIGFVFQMFHLLPYLNVVENVLLAAPDSMSTATLRQDAEDLLKRFGMDERRWHRPSQLSAGERQRVAMARAMLNRPKLLIADEPTGNLDRENATVLLNLLADYHAEGGTILLATHDESAADRAQRRITLSRGKVVAGVAR